ncbi:hypothetical protein PR048_013062, partial [Dryococelus australis]
MLYFAQICKRYCSVQHFIIPLCFIKGSTLLISNVHNMGTEKPFMFVWNESMAKRGSSEVTSCIMKYIELHFELLKMYHPKQWLEVIVNASLAFSAYYMDKEDFIDPYSIERMFKKQSDFIIRSFNWIQFSSEEPNTVRTRVSHNTLQPWHSYVIRPLPRVRKHLRPLPTVLLQLYEKVIAVKKAIKKRLARHVQVSSRSI